MDLTEVVAPRVGRPMANANTVKAEGSNPAPATTDRSPSVASGSGGVFVFRAYFSTKPAACITPANCPRTEISAAPLS